jgi:FkbM family methyltransferase
MVRNILRWIYARARRTFWNLRRGRRCLRSVSGLSSKARVVRLVAESCALPDVEQPLARTAIAVHDARYGQDLWLRPRSTDLAAFDFVEERYHLPPEIDPPFDHIAVFGANIGIVLVDLAARFPEARLLAVEPYAQNAAVARRNLAPLGDRCTFVETAVWHEDAELELIWTEDAWGFNLARNVTAEERAEGTHFVKAIEAGALLDEFTGGRPVDFIFINIESAWYELLRHGEWTHNVRSLKVEIVDHYEEVVPLLESLGFRARLERLSWGGYGVATRP